MKNVEQNHSFVLNELLPKNLERSGSVFSVSPSRYSRLSVRNEGIIKKLQKLNSISQSVDITSITKNPLNMVEYQMQGEKSRHDPQMVLSMLRKMQNRAELHRASNEMKLLEQYNNSKKPHLKRFASHCAQNSEQKKQTKLNYLKIYQSYLKQKQFQKEIKQRYEDDEGQIHQEEQFDETKDGVKYFNSLKKHPKIIDFTLIKKHNKQGITQREMETQRKSSLTKAVQQNKGINEYDEQKIVERQKQAKIYFENPQQIIERQITKFYLKKNPGSLSSEAEKNERSLNLMKKQKQLSFQVDENKISKDDKKRLGNKFNELVNELARSDRRNSLQGVLPKLKESQTVRKIELKDEIKRKLFN